MAETMAGTLTNWSLLVPPKELVSEPCSQGVGHRGTTVVGGDGSWGLCGATVGHRLCPCRSPWGQSEVASPKKIEMNKKLLKERNLGDIFFLVCQSCWLWNSFFRIKSQLPLYRTILPLAGLGSYTCCWWMLRNRLVGSYSRCQIR